jgi:inorganic pyrophosphatase
MGKPLNVFAVALQLTAVAAAGFWPAVKSPASMLPRIPFGGNAFRPASQVVPSRRLPVFNAYKTEVVGQPGTAEYRLKFADDSGKSISPWHDVPLSAGDGAFNALFEIPKMTKPKMEVATKEEGNPIAQDEKKGKLRDYHGPIFWNYGMFPQTWEDPNEKNAATSCNGDNDPLDVVEIGSEALAQGTVAAVKPLGALAMIDEGELDWKVIAIKTDDPMAAKMNDIGDVPDEVISGIREWFRWYKTPDGKPLNAFGFDEKALNKAETLKVIDETHEAWKNLVGGKSEAGKLWVKCNAPPALYEEDSTDSPWSLEFRCLMGIVIGSSAAVVVHFIQIAHSALRQNSISAKEEPLLWA